jgi:hypothetical protein
MIGQDSSDYVRLCQVFQSVSLFQVSSRYVRLSLVMSG